MTGTSTSGGVICTTSVVNCGSKLLTSASPETLSVGCDNTKSKETNRTDSEWYILGHKRGRDLEIVERLPVDVEEEGVLHNVMAIALEIRLGKLAIQNRSTTAR